MAQSVASNLEIVSNDNSTKEFLLHEKTCEAFKDNDEEIKMIFNEIKKLSDAKNLGHEIDEDNDDVELILKRAENIALETENLLKSSPVAAAVNGLRSYMDKGNVPQIKVTKPTENVHSEHKTPSKTNQNGNTKQNAKESNEVRRKPKLRPFSAGVIDSKKKEAAKVARFVTNSPKKITTCKHESILEELKDTNERVKSLELLNVQLTDDNKTLRKKLDQINEEKYVAELKITECEKFVNRLSKEYENRNSEFKSVKQNETSLMAELSKERNERKNLVIQRDKDAVVIQDLQRQVKEMELILKRKHPDSVSALIVASKSSTVEDNKKKLLEERIARLEQELKDKENHFQSILVTLQEKFGDMKQKYENHIIDVERQLMEDRKVNNNLKSKINKLNLIDAAVQTTTKNLHSTGTQTLHKSDRASSAVSRLTQNSALIFNKLKEDSYLVATIKGLQAELTVKQRTISKINRETEELRKNLRNLQKEKEVLLNLNPQKKTISKQVKSTENIMSRLNTEMEAELSEARKQKETLMEDRIGLLASLKRTNEDLILLKKKRIQDLHTLQLAHEKELMQMNMQLYPLQEEIKLLNRTVEILQERVRTADDKLLKYQAGCKADIHAGGDNPVSKIK
ncbi:centrosomal protein of 162 kDa-like isoform X1 [Maniola jurtina]|uniref:centrosomal protein of 162 kDa-like isoform X1 n=1 Tax=Maniola jurtina TaxID=191418 RepID=UPI001E6885EA|nr:centrosomal protein of 162 kDa-like isoform X1 [Maniola jurtina]